MTAPNVPWKLKQFRRRLDQWRDREQPPDRLYETVEAWIATREHTPMRNARRRNQESLFNEQQHGAEDGTYWRAQIPGAVTENGTVVCDYQVFQADGTVVCEDFGTI